MIILAATPIGNLGDVTGRLTEALTNAETIAAEDTRTTIKLLRALGIESRPRLISLHEHNERAKAQELVAFAQGADLLVLSDAGMPTVSDPGYVLVAEAIASGVTVTALPGPSAVLTALAVSGIATDRFTFEGFLPRKGSDRRNTLRGVSEEPRTMVFFESPHRLADALADMSDVLGSDRRIAVCRELTKLHEEVKRGTAAELTEWAQDGVKGEICIVVAGAVPAETNPEDALASVNGLVAAGARLKDACAEVARVTGLSSRDLYQAALDAKKAGS